MPLGSVENVLIVITVKEAWNVREKLRCSGNVLEGPKHSPRGTSAVHKGDVLI